MADPRQVLKGLYYCSTECSPRCPYNGYTKCSEKLCTEARELLEHRPTGKTGRITYYENWQSLGEAFVCDQTENGTDWETKKVFFIKRGMINWDIIRILRNWQRDYIPYYFCNED